MNKLFAINLYLVALNVILFFLQSWVIIMLSVVDAVKKAFPIRHPGYVCTIVVSLVVVSHCIVHCSDLFLDVVFATICGFKTTLTF